MNNAGQTPKNIRITQVGEEIKRIGGEMTNYNERLCEILNTLGERHIMVEHRLIHIGMPEQNGKNIETRKAKQAITSLIKELVAEARLDENNMYIRELTRHYFPSSPSEPHIPLVQFHERIAELKAQQEEVE